MDCAPEPPPACDNILDADPAVGRCCDICGEMLAYSTGAVVHTCICGFVSGFWCGCLQIRALVSTAPSVVGVAMSVRCFRGLERRTVPPAAAPTRVLEASSAPLILSPVSVLPVQESWLVNQVSDLHLYMYINFKFSVPIGQFRLVDSKHKEFISDDISLTSYRRLFCSHVLASRV